MRRRRSGNSRAGLFAMIAWLAQAACDGAPSSPSSTVALGMWGGDHVTMSAAIAGSHFEFDCAHGDVATPLVLDVRGRFSANGTFVREHGGPIRQDEGADSHPATYTGTALANTMMLTVRLSDLAETIGTFTLAYESQGRVVKCL